MRLIFTQLVYAGCASYILRWYKGTFTPLAIVILFITSLKFYQKVQFDVFYLSKFT